MESQLSPNSTAHQDEPTVATRRIHEGRILNLREDTVRMPSGREAKREIVEHAGAACIVPVLPDGRVVVVRQYRKPVEGTLLEVPAGGLEKGEDPLAAAHRELAEECNLKGDITPLFTCYLAPGYSTELMYGYLALNCQPAEGTPDEDENLEVEAHPLEDLLAMIETGEIKDSKSLCGLLALYRQRMQQA